MLPSVKSFTHGEKILDELFVNQPDAYVCKVVNNGIVKTKHMAMILLAVSSC